MNSTTILTQDDLVDFLQKYIASDVVVVDTETTGLDVWGTDELCGIAVYLPELDESYYLPTAHGQGYFSRLSDEDVAGMTWRRKDKKLVLTDKVYKSRIDRTGWNFEGNLATFRRHFDKPTTCIMHNAPFDLAVLDRAGFPQHEVVIDTVVYAHLLLSNWSACKFPMPDTGQVENGNKRLKWLARLFKVPGATEGEGALERAAEFMTAELRAYDQHCVALDTKGHLWALPPDVVGVYAEYDVRLTWAIYEIMQAGLKKWNLEGMARRLCRVQQKALYPAMATGFRFDRAAAEQMSREAEDKLNAIEAQMAVVVGRDDFNPRSVPQVKQALLDLYNLEVPSTDKTMIAKYKDDYELVSLLDQYRSLVRLVQTYINKWLDLPDDVVRAQVNITGTVTGRCSSGSEQYGNLQNIPANTDSDYAPKKLLLPLEGHHVVEIDYQALEMRVMAYIAESTLEHPDKTLTRLINEDVDMHGYTRDQTGMVDILLRPYARAVELEHDYNYAISSYLEDHGYAIDGTDEEREEHFLKLSRQKAKIVNFACAYGSGGRSLVDLLKLDLETCREIVDGWREAYPSIPAAMSYYEQVALTTRKAPDGTGRHQYIQYPILPFIRRYEALPPVAYDKDGQRYSPRESEARNAFNSVVQGTAGLMTITGMERIADRIERYGLKSRLLGTVHDSVILSMPPEEIETELPKFMGLMERWMTNPPMKVDVEVAPLNMGWGYKEPFAHEDSLPE